MATLHDCRYFSVTRAATAESPYGFAGRGLPNVFLVGIEYLVCSVCGRQSAEIPAIAELFSAIARAVVRKRQTLTGADIKFLRKQMGMKTADFAAAIGVARESVSRWENGHKDPQESADRLIRITYSILSGDERLKCLVEQRGFQDWITSIKRVGSEECIVVERVHNPELWCFAAEQPNAAATRFESGTN